MSEDVEMLAEYVEEVRKPSTFCFEMPVTISVDGMSWEGEQRDRYLQDSPLPCQPQGRNVDHTLSRSPSAFPTPRTFPKQYFPILTPHIPSFQLELELSKTTDRLALTEETLSMSNIQVSELELKVNSFSMAIEINSRPKTGDHALKEAEKYSRELEDMLELLEIERSEGDDNLHKSETENVEVKMANKKLTRENSDLNKANAILDEEMKSLKALLTRKEIERKEFESSGVDDIPNQSASLSAASSCASFHSAKQHIIAHPISLSQALGSPGLDSSSASSALTLDTPRSERETEDIMSSLEQSNRLLKDENVDLKERAKRERRRRKDEAEKHYKNKEEQEGSYIALEVKLELVEETLNKELDETKTKLKKTFDELIDYKRSKQKDNEASIKRTRRVVNLAVESAVVVRYTNDESKSNSRNSSRANSDSEDEDDDDKMRFSKGEAAWNNGNSPEQERRESSSASLSQIAPPDYPPPQSKRKSSTHDKKWLDEKLQRMGVRGRQTRRSDASPDRQPGINDNDDGNEWGVSQGPENEPSPARNEYRSGNRGRKSSSAGNSLASSLTAPFANMNVRRGSGKTKIQPDFGLLPDPIIRSSVSSSPEPELDDHNNYYDRDTRDSYTNNNHRRSDTNNTNSHYNATNSRINTQLEEFWKPQKSKGAKIGLGGGGDGMNRSFDLSPDRSRRSSINVFGEL